jgi:hypothetical protein
MRRVSLDSWNSFFESLAVVLLFVTFVISARALIASRRIRERERVRFAAAELKTAEANESAAHANRKALEAAEGTAKATAVAAEANERAAKLELETARQKEKAAIAERQLLELQEKIRPRRLTEAAIRALSAAFRGASPKGLVTIQAVLGDGEGAAFANQLNDVLKAAGWSTSGVSLAAFVGGPNPTGVRIVVKSVATAPPYAAVLQQAFERGGLPVDGAVDSSAAEGVVLLLVGNKPS